MLKAWEAMRLGKDAQVGASCVPATRCFCVRCLVASPRDGLAHCLYWLPCCVIIGDDNRVVVVVGYCCAVLAGLLVDSPAHHHNQML
jgi:hypothetical protein